MERRCQCRRRRRWHRVGQLPRRLRRQVGRPTARRKVRARRRSPLAPSPGGGCRAGHSWTTTSRLRGPRGQQRRRRRQRRQELRRHRRRHRRRRRRHRRRHRRRWRRAAGRALQAELCRTRGRPTSSASRALPSTDTPKRQRTACSGRASSAGRSTDTPKRQRTDCIGRPSSAGRALPSASAAAGRALQAETPVPTTVGEMLKAMRALEGPDPLEDLLE